MQEYKKYSIKNGAKAYLGAIFLPQILSIFLIMILSIFFKDAKQMQASMVYVISMMLIAQLGFAFIYWWINKHNKINSAKASKIYLNINPANLILCVLISVVAIAGFANLVGIFDAFFQSIGYEATSMLLPNNNFGYFILNVLICAIIPAIMEELLFRGIIYNSLKGKGFWFATIISSIMFMSVHLSLSSLIYPLIMGVIFCLVVQKTGSIIYSIIIHFCNNFFVILIEYFNNITGNNFGSLTINVWWQTMLVIVGAIIAFLLILFIIKKMLKQTNDNFSSGVRSQNVRAEENGLNNENNSKSQQISLIIEKKQDNFYLYGALVIGLIFWLLIIILSLV